MTQGERIDDHEKRIGKAEQMLNNGLSRMPGRVNWILGLFITLLFVLLGGGGALISRTDDQFAEVGERLTRVEVLLETSIEGDE